MDRTGRKFTAARWRALQWFRDIERDKNSVLARRAPTRRMTNTMLREGQLMWQKTNMSGMPMLVLSAQGERDMASKFMRVKRAKSARVDAVGSPVEGGTAA